MPDRVGPGALPVGKDGVTYVGVEAAQVTAVGVPLGRRPLLVCGRAKTGRTSLLLGIGQALRRADAALPILAITPRPTGLFDRLGAVELSRPDEVLVELRRLTESLGEATYGQGVRAAVLIDDAHRWEERWNSDDSVRAVLTLLAELVAAVAAGDRDDIALLAAAHTDQVRDATMQSGLLDALHRTRRGVLLSPQDNDGMLLGADVPAHPMEPLIGVGRGLYVEAGDGRLLQFVTSG